MPAVLMTIIAFIESNPAIVALGEQAVEAAIDFVKSAFAAHQAGVLTDDQITAAWALVTSGSTVAHQEVTDTIAAWRSRHPIGATGTTA